MMPEPGEIDTPLLRASDGLAAPASPEPPAGDPGPAAAPPPPHSAAPTPPAPPPTAAPDLLGSTAPPPAPPPRATYPGAAAPAPVPSRPGGWRRGLGAIALVVALLAGGALFGSTVRGGSLFSDGNNSATPSRVVPSDAASTGNSSSNSATGDVTPALVNITTTLANGLGEGAGTGMLISSSGYVLTNNHVIDGAQDINVEIGGNGSSHSATVVGYDMRDDVALIKVDDVSGLDTIPVGNPDGVQVGDAITVAGNALGRGGDPSTASGTVTATNRQITATDANGANAETLSGLIQVQADVQPGDSGGALVDANGKVVGMTTAASTNNFRFNENTNGVGFAIRIDNALDIAKQIQNGQAVDGVHIGDRALLGVAIQDTSSSPFGGRNSNGNVAENGALVTGVSSDSPAADAGIQEGDVITAIADTTVHSSRDLQDVLNNYHPNDKVKVSWTDGSGDTQSATVKLTDGPPA